MKHPGIATVDGSSSSKLRSAVERDEQAECQDSDSRADRDPLGRLRSGKRQFVLVVVQRIWFTFLIQRLFPFQS